MVCEYPGSRGTVSPQLDTAVPLAQAAQLFALVFVPAANLPTLGLFELRRI